MVAQQGKKLTEMSWIDDERKTDMVQTDRLVHTDHSGKKGRREDRGGHLAICQVVTVAASAGVPSPSPRFSILPEGLTTEIYYRERIESKISKGKRHVGQSSEETRHRLSRVPLSPTPTPGG